MPGRRASGYYYYYYYDYQHQHQHQHHYYYYYYYHHHNYHQYCCLVVAPREGRVLRTERQLVARRGEGRGERGRAQ